LLTDKKDCIISLSEAYRLTPPRMHGWSGDRDMREAGLKRERQARSEIRCDVFNRVITQSRASWGPRGADRCDHTNENHYIIRGTDCSSQHTQSDRSSNHFNDRDVEERYRNKDFQRSSDRDIDAGRDRARDTDRQDTETQWPKKQCIEMNKPLLWEPPKRSTAVNTGYNHQYAAAGHASQQAPDSTGHAQMRDLHRDGTSGHHNDRACKSGGDQERGRERDRYNEIVRSREQRPSKQFNIDLNKQLMRISDTRELYDFVSTHAAEFNHVNVATAFRQVLEKPRGINPKSLAQAY